MPAGEALPERVWAHGFIYFGGDRFSKSAGVKLDLREAIARHGPDALRYFLLREVRDAGDGNFSWERYDERYIADLADGLGNLASRSLAMTRSTSRHSRWPPASLDTAGPRPSALCERDGRSTCAAEPRRHGAVTAANQFIVQAAPWTLAKQQKEMNGPDSRRWLAA
jgi:methionyl-tRNA synthetase